MSKDSMYSIKIEITKYEYEKQLKLFPTITKDMYKKIIKNTIPTYTLSFYDDYLLYSNEEKETKYTYKDIKNIIETDTNFYFEIDNIILNLPKRDIDFKFISFIRRTFDDIDNRIGEDVGIKEVGKFHDSKVMKKVLLFLFIITIASFILSLITWFIVIKNLNIENLSTARYRWVSLFYLPIPIITTIIGFIYHNRGHDCLKNIIAGFIVFFCILGFGVTSFRPSNILAEFERDMSFLNNYKDVLGVELPKKGRVMFLDDTSCGDTEGQYFTCDNVLVQIEDYEDFEESLFSNKNWIKGEEVSEEFRVFAIGGEFDKNYHSIYNETLDQYNVFPKEKGKYKFYVMSYIYESSVLNINIFEYEVK